ncbi:uncharacterized protein N7515_002427 [Penicillium bovifimosum]|uniref:Cytochrome c oxidase-assembly factor COX23, mitochondrial n=1 Tax=Penicillium bovifimosum TaxID=126998 RepID=A0A9W9L837_9EURO|nr:uncharacterized protein N7515_002427 [Penicillium bovifimosum]KAJ5143640.1 hypothetical protein N7515_002427 [Penicillium bovifimosum]
MAAESTQDDSHAKAWEKAEKKFTHKHASEYYDPCQDFADRSLKCMKRNAYDRELCHDYFQYVPDIPASFDHYHDSSSLAHPEKSLFDSSIQMMT